ncbi:MAG: hypothetical protein AB8B96_01335 [Lysobacterales bacterium]
MYRSILSRFIQSILLLLMMLTGDPAAAQRFTTARAVTTPDQPATVSVTLSPLGNAEVSGGTFTLSFDPALVAVQTQCNGALGDPTQPTHLITCTVDTNGGEISIDVTSVAQFPAAVLTGDQVLGLVEVTLLDGTGNAQRSATLNPDAAFFRDTLGLLFVSADSSIAGQVDFIAGWPVDLFELDDIPARASNLDESTIEFGVEFVAEQLHAFDDGSDEDWLVQIRGVDVPNQPHLAVQALDPVQNPEFHPLLEIFDTQRLIDDSQAPVLVIGDCNAAPAAINQPIPELTQTRLLRVTHCGPVPAGGVDYRVTRRQGINNAAGVSVVQGRVSEAITDRPVQVLIFSDSNQIGVSGVQDGRYALTLLANQQATLRVISEDFLAEALVVGPLAENAISNNNDFAVSRVSDSIYSDGFEELP